MKVETRHERRRGCGFRKPGGLYLVSDGPAAECCRLPLTLTLAKRGITPVRVVEDEWQQDLPYAAAQ